MSNVKKSAAKANRNALKLAAKLAAAALVAQSTTLAAPVADETTISQTVEAPADGGPVETTAPVAVEVAAPVVVIPQNVESAGLIRAFAEKMGLVLGDIKYVQAKTDAYSWLGNPANRVSVYADAAKKRPAGLFRAGKRLSEATANTLIAQLKKEQAAS
jgi:hypothetical protein